jgi:hypothetical protein
LIAVALNFFSAALLAMASAVESGFDANAMALFAGIVDIAILIVAVLFFLIEVVLTCRRVGWCQCCGGNQEDENQDDDDDDDDNLTKQKNDETELKALGASLGTPTPIDTKNRSKLKDSRNNALKMSREVRILDCIDFVCMQH